MTTTRRRNRNGSPLSPADEAARDFLKKFKEVMQADLRYKEYFLTNDKAITYSNLMRFYKRDVLPQKDKDGKIVLPPRLTEQQLVIALHLILSKGWVMSNTKLTEALTYKVTRIPPIDS